MADKVKFETFVDAQGTAFQEYVSSITAKLPKTDKEYRAIRKRCGSIITSEHSHDLKWCKCRGVAVDGGRDYLKRLTGNPPSEFVELSIVDGQGTLNIHKGYWP